MEERALRVPFVTVFTGTDSGVLLRVHLRTAFRHIPSRSAFGSHGRYRRGVRAGGRRASSSAGGGSGRTASLPTMPAHGLSWLGGCPRVMPGQCCWCRGAPGLPQDHSRPACTAPSLLPHGDRLCRLPSSCQASWPAPPRSLQRFS